ncbi:hypothetical protein MNBD_NITROSPINAE04-1382 [hydrothermal vent metagenome]|uniref:Uncharacterized protein n=1 Tax=hydrothermal vent metagenome TaxID=652676 RepID=A0A3B1CDE3_9ZZZZ
MKIDGIDPANKGLPSIKPVGKEPVSGASFASLYNNLISKTGASDPSSTSAPPLPGAGLPFMAPPVGPDSFSGSMAVDRMESLFTDLEMFKNALANSDIPVDRLAPLVSEFVGRKNELAVMIGRIPDQELKSVVSDALTVVIDLVNQYHAGYTA